MPPVIVKAHPCDGALQNHTDLMPRMTQFEIAPADTVASDFELIEERVAVAVGGEGNDVLIVSGGLAL